jgi:hypothetical protein
MIGAVWRGFGAKEVIEIAIGVRRATVEAKASLCRI